jgi:hypothetical protein
MYRANRPLPAPRDSQSDDAAAAGVFPLHKTGLLRGPGSSLVSEKEAPQLFRRRRRHGDHQLNPLEQLEQFDNARGAEALEWYANGDRTLTVTLDDGDDRDEFNQLMYDRLDRAFGRGNWLPFADPVPRAPRAARSQHLSWRIYGPNVDAMVADFARSLLAAEPGWRFTVATDTQDDW